MSCHWTFGLTNLLTKQYQVIVFPNCKINLGLRVLRKRNDGYHDLETVFYPLSFYDVLEIIQYGETKTSFTISGLMVEPDNNNLCMKAYDLLKKDFPNLASAKIHLHKVIPSGAGLGGGSSDAAFALKLLNEKFHLGVSPEKLLDYASQLGSDCPFFIINRPCYATGRGEILEQIKVDLSSYKIVIINPDIHSNTAKAFTGIIPALPQKPVKEIIQQPIETWKDDLINDFETTIFNQYPAIKNIKEELYSKGALYASLSGSGSTVYGIFKKDSQHKFSFPSTYFTKELNS